MGKAAGIWKKVKKLGQSIGGKSKKAFQWANENIIRPNKNLIHNLNDTWDETGIVNKVLDGGSDYLHEHTDLNKVDTKYKDKIKGAIDTVVNETQGYGDDKEYYNGFGDATPVNNIIKEGIKVGRRLLGGNSNW